MTSVLVKNKQASHFVFRSLGKGITKHSSLKYSEDEDKHYAKM